MSSTISVLFFAPKSKVLTNGTVAIRIRISVAAERFDASTKLYIREADWSQSLGCAIGSSEESRHINACLEGFRVKAYDYQRELMMKGLPVTAEAMRTKWLGLDTERPSMILEIFDQHNEQMGALIGKEFTPKTLERYRTSRKHTHDFMFWKYKVNDIDIKKLNYEFMAARKGLVLWRDQLEERLV
jgi:hypothetical protein